jgi:hypothetical protein
MGHRLTGTYPLPSGWRALCSCGHTSRGIRSVDAIDAHDTHTGLVP